jgi:hypothetical protein
MKLNRFALFSVTSALIAVAPISYAIADQSGIQTVVQSQSMAIASGTFVAGEAPTTGIARIVTEDGHRYLELDTAFSTSNMGPDLHVLLEATETPPQSYVNLGSAVNLGSLQNFSGAQRYPIPDTIDLAEFNSVVIWCRMANATFGYAPLSSVSNAGI